MTVLFDESVISANIISPDTDDGGFPVGTKPWMTTTTMHTTRRRNRESRQRDAVAIVLLLLPFDDDVMLLPMLSRTVVSEPFKVRTKHVSLTKVIIISTVQAFDYE